MGRSRKASQRRWHLSYDFLEEHLGFRLMGIVSRVLLVLRTAEAEARKWETGGNLGGNGQ